MKTATEIVKEMVEHTNELERRAINVSSSTALMIYLARKKEEKEA